MKLNLNQMDNKNEKIIKHNVYSIQFLQIINAFVQQLLKKYIKKEHHFNINHIYDCLHQYVLTLFFKFLKLKKIENNEEEKGLLIKYKTKNKQKKIKEEIIIKILTIFNEIVKYQVKIMIVEKSKPRIKKRINNNKFNYRGALINE
jgi:hypothetical protein